MIRLLWSWLLWRLAESDARNQRRFAIEQEERWHAAERGIPICDAIASQRAADYRNAKLRARFPVNA